MLWFSPLEACQLLVRVQMGIVSTFPKELPLMMLMMEFHIGTKSRYPEFANTKLFYAHFWVVQFKYFQITGKFKITWKIGRLPGKYAVLYN